MSDAHTHTIKDGESVESIAANNGLPVDEIWNLKENEELRKKRPAPQIMNPGDKLAVPATKPLTYERPTGQTHEFSVHVPRSVLKLTLKKVGKPRANEPCELVVDGFKHPPLTTDGDGNLEAEISAKARSAKLTVGTGKNQVVYKLRLHGIHPISEPTGWQARLQNLGYPVDVDGDGVGNMSHAALCLFQESQNPQKLAPTGKLDDDTRKKLEQRHGC